MCVLGLSAAGCASGPQNKAQGDEPAEADVKRVKLEEPAEAAAKRAKCEAEKGDAAACLELASMYYKGTSGVSMDKVKSAELVRTSCKLNDVSACTLLASLMMTGDGVPEDREGALIIYEGTCGTCKSGDGFACNRAGVAYELGVGGVGVGVDLTRAAGLYQLPTDWRDQG